MRQKVIYDVSPLTDNDIYLFREGSHFGLYDKMGAHPMASAGLEGVHFSVFAPNAEMASVIGDFNGWDKESHPLVTATPGITAGAGTETSGELRPRQWHSTEEVNPFPLPCHP